MNPRVVLALALVCVFALGAVVIAAGGDERHDSAGATHFQGALMPRGVRAPDFRLRDQDGRVVKMRALRGRPVLVTFLYTTCHDTCPAMAQIAREALDDLGHGVPALAIAVDPPRDTPARARAFLLKQRAAGLDFVLGTRSQLEPVWRGFAIQPESVSQEHQARFTLVDKRGYQRIGYPGSNATPAAIAHDLRLLERE